MIKVTKDLFTKNFWLNILMCFQICICLILSNVLIGNYNYTFSSHNFTHNFDNYLFATSFSMPSEKLVNNVDKNKIESYNSKFSFYKNVEENMYNSYFCYGSEILNIYKPFLKYGKWFDECNDIESGAIKTVVVSSKKNLVGSYVTKNIESKNYKFYVCGSFGDELLILEDSVTVSSGGSSSVMFPKFKGNFKTGFMCDFEDCKEFSTVGTRKALVLVNESNKEETMNELAKNFDIFVNTNQMRESDKEDFDLYLKIIMPFALTYGALGLISLITMLVVNIKTNRNLFDCFYTMGIRKTDIFQIALTYSGFVGIFTFAIFVFFMIAIKMTKVTGILINIWNVLFTLIFFIILILLIELMFFVILKQKDISNE